MGGLGEGLRYWRDYRSFRRLPADDRRIVFYSESGQDWHHFRPVIEELTEGQNQAVCYVSSDPADPGLATGDPRIRGFCIGSGLVRIVFFQFLRAGVMVMTMIDLGNLQLKRSIYPAHYVFMFHSLISTHMADFENSYDHYDTILCAGPHHVREIRRREELAGLKPKRLVPHGYHRLESLMAKTRELPSRAVNDPPHVLLAPSWGPDTILNVCGDEVVRTLLDAGFRVTLRPHYQTRLLTPEAVDTLLERFGDHSRFDYVDRMGEEESLYKSDIMITDWSGAGMDYGMGLEKPVLYIDLPPKSRNKSWPKLEIEPFECLVRTRIGQVLTPDRISAAPKVIASLLADAEAFRKDVRQLREEWVFNLGHSAGAAAAEISALSRTIGVAAEDKETTSG